MKKLIIGAVLLVSLLCTATVFADNSHSVLEKFDIVDETDFSTPGSVTRGECMIPILRVLGVTDYDINALDGADLVSFADTAPFSYFGCAYLSDVAYGEWCKVDYPTPRTRYTRKNVDIFFFPHRAVTVKECLAFMNRCLQPGKPDFGLTIEDAKNNKLINNSDIFIQNPDSLLTHDDFLVLLERLMQQKRFKYYEREEDGGFDMSGLVDEERSITYFEMLNARQ